MPDLPCSHERVPEDRSGIEKAGKPRAADNSETTFLGNGTKSSTALVAERKDVNENS